MVMALTVSNHQGHHTRDNPLQTLALCSALTVDTRKFLSLPDADILAWQQVLEVVIAVIAPPKAFRSRC